MSPAPSHAARKVPAAASVVATGDFISRLELYIKTQLKSQRVGYLLGARASYLSGDGYPLAGELWDHIKDNIGDAKKCAAIQEKLDGGANGIEQALDLLDDGGAQDTPYRQLVTAAIAELFLAKSPPLRLHIEFVQRLSHRGEPLIKIFSLNYDPLVERAAERARVRLLDGFLGMEHAYFHAPIFEERIGRIRGHFRSKLLDETAKPLHLLKLHGSLGWYECPTHGVRRCAFGSSLPTNTKPLMVPPQRRKATDTMLPPYAALWSSFRGSLGQDANPIHRLVCLGYGFADEHVNAVIESALARSDFTVLIFTKALGEAAWNRWGTKPNVAVVTEKRCSLKGEVGCGHPDLWSFERIAQEV
jgi:SIR2-like domain